MERNNPEITRTFRAYGGEVRKSTDFHFMAPRFCPHCGKMSRPAGGASTPAAGDADYYVVLKGRGLFIEAKWDDQRISFDAFSPDQRRWLNTHWSDSWIWIWLGASRPNQQENPCLAWLLPWVDWLRVEQQLQNEGLKGLPYQAHKLEHRMLSAPVRLKKWELSWAGNSAWAIPFYHPLRRQVVPDLFFSISANAQEPYGLQVAG
jgi:hypothetical protein